VATARERLLQALTSITSQPISEEGLAGLNRLLNSYRVQAKPGESNDKEQTARDSLAAKLIDAWHKQALHDKDAIDRIVDSYRMQLKHGLSRGRMLESKPDVKTTSSPVDAGPKGAFRTKTKENNAKHENAYFKDKKDASDDTVVKVAIAGGPKVASNTRGQCPKCRSLGIVLARAYGGDDYHSCIYCGYQAYLKDADPTVDLPLAASLLHALKEPKIDDED
jgi:hypothetical protein